MPGDTFTPVERKMMRVLSDGLPHRPAELHACLNDDLAPVNAFRWHVSNLRKKLRPGGEDILCEIWNRTVHYRHVRLLVANG